MGSVLLLKREVVVLKTAVSEVHHHQVPVNTWKPNPLLVRLPTWKPTNDAIKIKLVKSITKLKNIIRLTTRIVYI
jgi:hypothetical protein